MSTQNFILFCFILFFVNLAQNTINQGGMTVKILEELSTILASPIEGINSEGLAIAVSNLGPYVWDKLSAESVEELLIALDEEYERIQYLNSLPPSEDDDHTLGRGPISTENVESAFESLSFVYRYVTGTLKIGLKIVVTEDDEVQITQNATFDPRKEWAALKAENDESSPITKKEE